MMADGNMKTREEDILLRSRLSSILIWELEGKCYYKLSPMFFLCLVCFVFIERSTKAFIHPRME